MVKDSWRISRLKAKIRINRMALISPYPGSIFIDGESFLIVFINNFHKKFTGQIDLGSSCLGLSGLAGTPVSGDATGLG